MHIQSGALALLLATAASLDGTAAFGIHGRNIRNPTSFVSRSPIHIHRTVSSKSIHHGHGRRSAMSMLADGGGGIEELKEMIKEGDSLSKTARKKPTLFKVGGIAAVPVSVILGAVATPSRRMAASAVGSAISGVAGYIGKNRLDAATEAAAKPAIAQAIIDAGLSDSNLPGHISDLQESFGVQDEDFAEMCMDVYKRYLTGMVKTPITKTSEIKEIAQLKKALKLTNLSVGEAHAVAAKDFYRQTCLFTPVEELDDPYHPDRMSIDKFLFLSERAFRQGGETDEAFKYEMSRVARAFDLKLHVAMDRVAEVAEPFYKRALTSTREKLDSGAVSSDMLSRARASLGIDDATASDLHLVTFADEVRSLLGKDNEEEGEVDLSTLKFPDGAAERVRFFICSFSNLDSYFSFA